MRAVLAGISFRFRKTAVIKGFREFALSSHASLFWVNALVAGDDLPLGTPLVIITFLVLFQKPGLQPFLLIPVGTGQFVVIPLRFRVFALCQFCQIGLKHAWIHMIEPIEIDQFCVVFVVNSQGQCPQLVFDHVEWIYKDSFP